MPRRVLVAAGALLSVVTLGTVGFMVLGPAPLLDALYMTVITISTVGFREVTPVNQATTVFTIFLVLAGVVGIGYSFGIIVEFMVEGHLTSILEGRRMQKRISELDSHYVIAGMGRVGSVVAAELTDAGVSFVVIDSCETCRETADEAGWLLIHGDATDEKVLIDAGIERARGLVAALDTDADNLFVSLSARTLNPSVQIVARSTSLTSESKILRSGADRVITPNVIGGRRMAAMLLKPAVADYLDVVTQSEGIEFRIDAFTVRSTSELVGRSIRDSRLYDRTGAFVLAVRRPGGPMKTGPASDDVLHAGDELVVLGTQEHLGVLEALV
jgi:voltage-gated potassium channel